MVRSIFKVLTKEQWKAAESGELVQAPVDVADGYVHFSTRVQLQETLNKWFKGQADCVLVSFLAEQFESDLKWEKSRGGDKFPHVYADVRATQAESLWLLEQNDEGIPQVPEEVVLRREKPGTGKKPDTIS